MAKFKNTEFAEGAKKLSFAEFSKIFAKHFTKEEMKEAFNVAKGKDGDTNRTTESRKKDNSKKN